MPVITNAERTRWAEAQMESLMDLGDSALDAMTFVAWVLFVTPAGEDVETYEIPEQVIEARAAITPKDIEAARAEWYASDAIPAEFKRILDAT